MGVRPDVADAVGETVRVSPGVTVDVGDEVTGAGDAVAVTGDAEHGQPAFVKAAGKSHQLRLVRVE